MSDRPTTTPKVAKYHEVSTKWREALTEAHRAGEPIESLCFVEQSDGTLKLYEKPIGEPLPGHCQVVTGVGTNEDGTHFADITFVTQMPEVQGHG